MQSVLSLLLLVLAGTPASDLGSKPHPEAQAAADFVREAAAADICFLPAGLLKALTGDLGTMLQYGGETVTVLQLSGSEIRQALERSLSSYPSPNGAFLQLSGITVVFSESAPADSRVVEVKVGDTSLSSGRQYSVAMPETLARGALGYFKIWDKSKAIRTLPQTLDELLRGKSGASKAPRYIAKS